MIGILMSWPNYTSCIKLFGCPLLPPLIDSQLKEEIQNFKAAAVNFEQELSLKKLSQTESKLSDSNDDAINPAIDLEECSEATIKLIEYIKYSLKEVAHEKDVQDLQSQIVEELKKCESSAKGRLETNNSISSDTLHNLDASSLSNDTESLQRECNSQENSKVNTSNDSELNSPEKEIVNPDGTPESPVIPTPIRRNSFTLESLSPAVMKFFETMAKDSNHNEGEASQGKSKSSRNLNDVYGCDSSYVDFSSYSTLSESLDNSKISHVIDCRERLPNNNEKNEGNISSPHFVLECKSNRNTNEEEKMLTSNGNTEAQGSKMVQRFKTRIAETLDPPSADKCAAIIQAGVRGYLTRRLLKTKKVMELKKTLRDSLLCALKLYNEEKVTTADLDLHGRLVRQVTAACYELHGIFFDWTIKDRMMLIQQDRLLALRILARKRNSSSEVGSRPGSRNSTLSRDVSAKESSRSQMSTSYPLEGPSASLLLQNWS